MKIWLDGFIDPKLIYGKEDFVWCKSVDHLSKIINKNDVDVIDFGIKLRGSLNGEDAARLLVEDFLAGKIKKFRWNIHDENASESLGIINILRELDRW